MTLPCCFHSALEMAAQNRHFEIVSYLVQEGHIVTKEAVTSALENRSIEALEWFLRCGWDINKIWKSFRLPSMRQVFLCLMLVQDLANFVQCCYQERRS